MNPESSTAFKLILIAAMLALPACSKSYSAASADVAARVNNEEIAVQRIGRAGSTSASTLPDRLALAALDQLIDQELLAQKARDTGIDRDPAVIAEIAAARQRILAHSYVERNTLNPEITITEISKFYDAHPALFAERKIYRFKELLTGLDAEHLASFRIQADGSTTLDELAKWLNERQLPVLAQASIKAAEQLPGALLPRISTMKSGQIALFEAADSVSIIQLLQVQDAPLSLDEARPAIEKSLLEARRQTFTAARAKQLRAKANVEYLGSFAAARDGTPLPPSPSPAGKDNIHISKGLRGLL